MDNDLYAMSREQLIAEVRKLRDGIRKHRSSGQDLWSHHPTLSALLPEKAEPRPVAPDWPGFAEGCIRYLQSRDRQDQQ